jgi:hypothetical protein
MNKLIHIPVVVLFLLLISNTAHGLECKWVDEQGDTQRKNFSGDMASIPHLRGVLYDPNNYLGVDSKKIYYDSKQDLCIWAEILDSEDYELSPLETDSETIKNFSILKKSKSGG